MKKEDLKTGMYVRLRDGSICIVQEEHCLLIDVKNGEYLEYESIENNLTKKGLFNRLGIVEVYSNYKMNDLLWKRKKLPKLTNDEKAILRNLPKEYLYIARDRNSELWIYTGKPYRSSEHWGCEKWAKELDLFKDLFQSINWENEEPYLISELLKNES